MVVLLIIGIVVVILIAYSNHKEKERQEHQHRIDADNIKTQYKDGYYRWLTQKKRNYSNSYTPSNDLIVSNKSEIIKLHNEIIEGYKVAARRDEQFEAEQKSFNDKCYDLSKEHLPNEGKYHYDVEWYKNKANGGRSKEQFTVWQFFVGALCLNQELDYTYSTYYKKEFENLPEFKDKSRYWNQPVYDRINTFISAVAKLSNRPLLIAFVDTKDGWSQEALEYHLNKIKRDIPNTLVSKLSQIKNTTDAIGNQLEHILVIDAYTENHQLIDICENLEKSFSPSHAAISYISLLKCYDRDEMVSILERKKKEEKQRLMHEQADSIRRTNLDGYDFWLLDLRLDGFKGEIQDQMIIESEDIIKQLQQEYEEDCRRKKEKKEKLETEYNRIKKKYPIGTEYYEKYQSENGNTIQEIVVGDEEGVAKYEIIYAKYLDLQKKYPLGLPAFEKHNSNDEGYTFGGFTIEEVIEHEEEIRQFEQKEANRLNQLRDNLPTKVKNWDTLQNGMHYCFLLRYYPTTCEFKATNKEWEDRNTVWNFKNDPAKVSSEEHDEALTWVLQNVKDKLLGTFGKESLKYLTLVCIPASSKMITERRYKDFSSMLCKETGMNNSYSFINITQDATPKHLGGTGKPTVEYNVDFFKNKNIIIFDDVITSGRSMLRMKLKMEQLGATVIAGISIGKTFHHRPDNQSNSSESQVGRSFDDYDDIPF